MQDIYRIYYHGDAFGDNLFSAYLTSTLVQHGLKAYLDNKKIEHLVDCPIFIEDLYTSNRVFSFDCVRRNRTGLDTEKNYNVFSDLISQFKNTFSISTDLPCRLNYIPVSFKSIPNCPKYDVVMITETGDWTPYRNWPYFEELKQLMRESGLKFKDLSESRIRDNVFLNYVNNSRVFLGLETGASHYASKFANGKTLIIQSGYAGFSYWAAMYDYDKIISPVNCSPCWKREGCDFDHSCMRNIKAIDVLEAIRGKLD